MEPLIYVVDDDPLMRDLLTAYLCGYFVKSASNGSEALAALEKLHPALIILDIDMPGMDGLQTLQILRSKLPQHRETPVMMLTASRHSESVKQAGRAGAAGYVVKPFSRDQFLKRVRQLARVNGVSAGA